LPRGTRTSAAAAAASSSADLPLQFVVANMPVINGTYTKEVFFKSYFPKKSSSCVLGFCGVTGVLTKHDMTSGSWPPFITEDFIKALGGTQEAAKRLVIFDFLHSPCLVSSSSLPCTDGVTNAGWPTTEGVVPSRRHTLTVLSHYCGARCWGGVLLLSTRLPIIIQAGSLRCMQQTV
jgi:hypothetical protein